MCVNILLFCRDSLLIFSLGDKRYHSTPKIFAPYCWPFTREDQKVGTFSQCGGCRPRSCNNTLWYCDQWTGPVFPRGLEIAQWRYKGVLRCQICGLNLFPFPWNSVIGLSITAVRCLATTMALWDVWRLTTVFFSFLIWVEVGLFVWYFLLTCR